MQKCELCDFETDSKIKLSKHILFTHKLSMSDYRIKTKYNGIHPLCSCGCGTPMKYMGYLNDFPKYIKKHLHVLCKDKSFEEIWGDPKSEKRVKAISDARKKLFKSGEFDHVKKAIKKARKDPGLGEKISKGSKGVPKPKPEGFGIGKVFSEETKKKISNSHKINWEIGNIGKRKHYTSKLEKTFANILDLLNIKYETPFYARPIKAFYDFYLEEYNLIIEVDGDFWHSNPLKYPEGPTAKCQIKNAKRDEEKNKWAEDNDYKLIRIWENDINNNIQKVKHILSEATCK